jgi:hypothetical protein
MTDIVDLIHSGLETGEPCGQEHSPKGQRRVSIVSHRQQVLSRIGTGDNDSALIVAVLLVMFVAIAQSWNRFDLGILHQRAISGKLSVLDRMAQADLLVDSSVAGNVRDIAYHGVDPSQDDRVGVGCGHADVGAMSNRLKSGADQLRRR